MNESSAGPAPIPSHWVRVQLAAGQSAAGLWDLSNQVPEARVTVGAGPDAGWNVQAPGVAPVHFELYWDGSSLWVSPPMAGQLTVDGERVQSWRQLAGRSRVEFGSAAMLVESSQAVGLAAPVAAQASTELAGHAAQAGERRGYQAPTERSTSIPPSPTGVLDLEDLSPIDDESTMVFDGQGVDIEGEATRMLDAEPLPPASQATAFPASAMRPVIGGAVAPHGRPAQPTLTSFSAVPPPPSGDAPLRTQILDTSDLGLDLASLDEPARPPLRAALVETDVLPRPFSSPPPGSAAAATGKFAMPPAGAEVTSTRAKLQLPPKRTLILLGVTLCVALLGLGVIMMRKSQRREAAARALQEAQSNQAGQAEAAAAAVRQRIELARTTQQEAEARLLAQAEPRITAALSEARTAAEAGLDRNATPELTSATLVSAEREALEKLGIDALGQNDYALAFACFQRLAREHPGGPYTAMVPILRSKLPCSGGVGPDGRPCTR